MSVGKWKRVVAGRGGALGDRCRWVRERGRRGVVLKEMMVCG